MTTKTKTPYLAMLRSAPYKSPRLDEFVCLGDIVQVRDIKEDKEIYVPERGSFDIGDTVFVEWHNELEMYKILYEFFLTDETNCAGGFYYLDGTQA